MHIDMQCSCGAAFQIENGPESLTMLYAERFAASHFGCGFMTQVARDVNDSTSSYNITTGKREKEY